MMTLRSSLLLLCLCSCRAFRPMGAPAVRSSHTKLSIVPGDKEAVLDKVLSLFKEAPVNEEFDKLVKSTFKGAISNLDLETRVCGVLDKKGFNGENTLLATSLCADELARKLEDDFVKYYGNNFNLGGLSGFPFAGNTGFGAMSAHIPDDGYCLIVYAPHVGISKDGVVGKVERAGIALVDNCCGSAIAASGYLQGITDGGATITTKLQEFSDFQQGAVQELILPHGKRLSDAENRMLELPYALYDSQELLMMDIFKNGAGGTKKGTAILGGIQINTSPDTMDYFHPLKFEYYNNKGELLDDMLDQIVSEAEEEEEEKEDEED